MGVLGADFRSTYVWQSPYRLSHFPIPERQKFDDLSPTHPFIPKDIYLVCTICEAPFFGIYSVVEESDLYPRKCMFTCPCNVL